MDIDTRITFLSELIGRHSIQWVVTLIRDYHLETYYDNPEVIDQLRLEALNKLFTDVNYNIINGYPKIPVNKVDYLFRMLDAHDYETILEDIAHIISNNRLKDRQNALMGGCLPRTDIYLDALVECVNSLNSVLERASMGL